MLLNIIHPHTFKGEGDTSIIGPSEVNHERDIKISNFVKNAMDQGNKVVSHKYRSLSVVDHLANLALELDPIYDFLSDDRIVNVCSTIYGTPLPDEKPEDISDDIWELLEEVYISSVSLGKEVQGQGDVVFIGGLLERCVANAAGYFDDHYRTPGQRLFYVPELCVSRNESEVSEIKEKLAARDITSISSEAAYELSTVG